MSETKLKRIHFILLFCVMVLLPLVMYPDGTRFNIARSKSLVLALIMIIYIITCFKSKSFSLELEAVENKFLWIYLLLLVIASFFAHNVARAFLGSPARLDGILSFLGYITAYYLARRIGVRAVLLKAAMISSLLVCGLAILQFFELDPGFLQLYPNSWKGFAFSTFGNPNFLASYLVLMLPVGLYFYFYKNKWWGLLSYAVVFFSLLCTETRGAWIGAAFGISTLLIFMLLQRRKISNRKVLVVVVLSLLVMVLFSFSSDHALLKELFSLYDDVETVITHPEDAKNAGTNRFYVWQKSMQLIREKPLLGFGPENMSYAMREHFHDEIVQEFGKYLNWDKAHNEYLNIAVSSGIPSLLVYLGFVGTCLIKGFSRRSNPLFMLLLSMAVGYLVQAFFNIQMVSVYYMFFVVLGFLSGRIKKKRKLYRLPSSFKVTSA